MKKFAVSFVVEIETDEPADIIADMEDYLAGYEPWQIFGDREPFDGDEAAIKNVNVVEIKS